MPRHLLTKAIQDLSANAPKAPHDPGSRRAVADDAGRLRWKSVFRVPVPTGRNTGTPRTLERHALMLHPCLVSVSHSGTTLFSQATWPFNSGGFQRMRTIEKAPHEFARRSEMHPTRGLPGNLVLCTEPEGATASSSSRLDSPRRKTLHETPLRSTMSHGMRCPVMGRPGWLARRSPPLSGVRRAQTPSAQVYLPLGA